MSTIFSVAFLYHFMLELFINMYIAISIPKLKHMDTNNCESAFEFHNLSYSIQVYTM